MRKNFGSKSYSYPQPVFILASYGEDGTPNAMTASCGGITQENELTMCITAEHKTTKDILARGAFTVSMADADHVTECDYVGLASGNIVKDKFARAGFHAEPSDFVDAPLIKELPVALECRLKSYDPETCRMVAEIVNVSVDESVLTGGKVDVKKAKPITFDPFNNTYVVLGDTVGKAFHDGKSLK